MTIVISAKVGEGLVLGADSTTTIMGSINGGPQQVLNTYNHARKLLQLKDYPIGTLTWGAGAIGSRNIESLVSEFEKTLPPLKENTGWSVESIAQSLFKFFEAAYDSTLKGTGQTLGMLIAGYSDGRFFPEEYEFTLPTSTSPARIRPDLADGQPQFGASWRGQVDAIGRLYYGVDEQFFRILQEVGVPEANIVEAAQRVSQLEWPIVYAGMPIQDAIDFVTYLLNVVVGRFRFLMGPATCGGDLDVAVITYKGFHWIRQKSWKVKQESVYM